MAIRGYPPTPEATTATESPTEPGGGADWPVQATDTIVRLVDSVRDRTTGPALDAVRWLIYGLVLLLLAGPLAVLALIGVFRLFEGLLWWVHDRGDWADFLHDPIGFVYLAFGLLFVLVALVLWHKAKAPPAATA
jgi:hypothetical protein